MMRFDEDFWEQHWRAQALDDAPHRPAHPYLSAETAHLRPGAALDAGCGTGAEAAWLAEHGWAVTAADISRTALASARSRFPDADVDWVEADLARWQPRRVWDLVITSYAHPDIGQLPFYRRIGDWVAPGGTLLIVGHLRDDRDGGHHEHPEHASAAVEAITSLFREPLWRIGAAYERTRLARSVGDRVALRDVIVRAHRRN